MVEGSSSVAASGVRESSSMYAERERLEGRIGATSRRRSRASHGGSLACAASKAASKK
tara:strand:- start:2813 stop:2986 length:174 start_codon:yes stop_codon:yes gene_type:complete